MSLGPAASPAALPLDPFDSHSPLTIQLLRIPRMRLLLAVFQPRAVVTLQHPVLGAVLAHAEAALADDRVDLLLALLVHNVFLVVAGWLLGHAAPEREREVEGALRCYGGKGRRGVEVLPCEY